MQRALRTTSSTTEAQARPGGSVKLQFNGRVYDCNESETVLDALLRGGATAPYSCGNGVCLSCMLRSAGGQVPERAQEGLRAALRIDGYFLACVCKPTANLDIVLPDDAAVYGRTTVRMVEIIAPAVCRVILEPATALSYRAGQFINLRRRDGLVRSYSLASVPKIDRFLDVHVKRLPGGDMSNWICDTLKPGDALDIQGPNGNSFYVPGTPDREMLMIGNGTGLSPLIGIARDALHSGHTGDIHLYHGSRRAEGLYLHETLRDLEAKHSNFHYVACVSGSEVPTGYRAGRADAAAFADFPDLAGRCVHLCGYPPMVNAAQKSAYLAGAGLDDIYTDPFELRELRSKPRD